MHIAVINQLQSDTTGNYFRWSWQNSHYIYHLSELQATFKLPLSLGTLPQKEYIDLLIGIDPTGVCIPIDLDKVNYPTAVYLIDVHQNLEQRLRLAYLFDYVFIAQKDYLQAFKDNGIHNVFWLPLACDPDFHSKTQLHDDRKYDVGFVGNRGVVGSKRRSILDALSKHFNVNDLTRRYPPEKIGEIYSQSQMVFNWSINGDVNMRIFEALCSGRLLLTNAIPNGLEELFTDRKHLVIYRSIEELLELVQYYLDHPEEREAIAQAGQAEVLAKHTYQHRADQILTTIFGPETPRLTAPIRSWPAQKRWEAYSKVFSDLRQPLATLRVTHQAIKQGEATGKLGALFMTASLRAINVRIPVTPNAIWHRWKVLSSSLNSIN